MFNYGYLIEFVCLKIDLIWISYNLVYWFHYFFKIDPSSVI